MSLWLSGTLFFALGCFLAAMTLAIWRLFRGPTAQDRVMALDYFYASGIVYASDAYFESALLISMFGFVSSSALAKFLLRGEVIE